MKKLLLLLFSGLSLIGFSQSYKPIVSEANSWSVVTAGVGSHLKIGIVKTRHFRFFGDTIINANNYKKVFCSQDSLKQNWVLYGFIRENISAKKVWFRNLENEEDILYDFDVEVGSKIGFNIFGIFTDTIQVTGIDSVLIQSEYHKRYSFGTSDRDLKWIEGIGSIFGIFNNKPNIPGGFNELLCFSDGHIIYTNPKYNTCYKSVFTPFIVNKSFDKAVLNKPYYFKIPTTEIYDYDAVSFLDSLPGEVTNLRLPAGLVLNHATGEISGTPTKSGDFLLTIYLWNHDHVTDYFSDHFIVDSNSGNIEPESEPAFSISPNPTNGFLSINCSANRNEFSVLIYNSVGELVISKIMNRGEKLDIHSLSSGVYVVKIMDKQNTNIFFRGKLLNQ